MSSTAVLLQVWANWSYTDNMVKVNGLGETKKVITVFETGKYVCPFCNYPTKNKCNNPVCETNLSAERILELRQKYADEKKESENRLRMFTYYGKENNMGWTYTQLESKTELIKELTKERIFENGNKCLSYSLGCHDKNVLWVVWQKYTDERFIVCYLLDNQNGWGYKDMDEIMHPYYYDCPDDLVELVKPEPPNYFNLEWRETRLKYFSDKDK